MTAQAGIHFKHNSGAFGKKYLPETMGSGVCFLDYDNDGWQDILFVNSMDWPEHQTGKSFPALYHNNQDGTFTDVTRAAGLAVEMYGMGCAVGDYDNDGFQDIYITAVGTNHLFHNLRNGKFSDVTARAGVSDPGFSTSAMWFDYDKDGKLDLFVSHYVDWSIEKDQYCSLDGKKKSYCTPQAYKGQSSTLFHNKGNGTFENVTKSAGLYDPTSKSLGIALLDYDNDGWLDLFVANDTEPNKLYRNNHDGTFTDVAVLAGVALSETGRARAGMGVDAADYDGSGGQGLIIGNFTNESMSLYHNDGSGLFTDEAAASGIGQMSVQSLTFGCFFFDYDLDGLPDIFAANGHVSDDISVVQPNARPAEPGAPRPHARARRRARAGRVERDHLPLRRGNRLPAPGALRARAGPAMAVLRAVLVTSLSSPWLRFWRDRRHRPGARVSSRTKMRGRSPPPFVALEGAADRGIVPRRRPLLDRRTSPSTPIPTSLPRAGSSSSPIQRSAPGFRAWGHAAGPRGDHGLTARAVAVAPERGGARARSGAGARSARSSAVEPGHMSLSIPMRTK